jgi:hypothetical protein
MLAEAGKLWIPSLLVDDCQLAVSTSDDPNSIANEVAFGYFWAKNCDVAMYLRNAHSVGFTFEYIHAESVNAIFIVTAGGRIFTQSCRVISSGTTILMVVGGTDETAFYHINGLALDAGANDCVLLTNQATSNGNHLFRFTNGHFICTDLSACPSSSSSGTPANCYNVSATIDRRGSSSGKSMLELVGCRGVAALDRNITIEGAAPGAKSHLIVRECEIRSAGQLVSGASTNYTYKGVENFTFPCGIVPDDVGAG